MKKNINKIILILLILDAIVIYFAIIKTHEKSQTIKLGKENLVSEIDIDYSVKANPLSKVEVKDLSKTDAEINACVGNLGQSFDISGNFYNFQLQEATVTMKYDESKLDDTPEERIGVLWDDKENNKMVIVDTKVDTEKNTISFKTEHFSEYILVNLDEWEEAWNKRVVKVRNELSQFDLVFVIDDSGSMTSNDPQDLRIDATKNFVDILGKEDTYSVVKFEDSAKLVVERTFAKEDVEKLEENFSSSGGTNISSGLEEGIKILDNGDTKSRVIVLLTDGEDSGLTNKREEIIRQAVRKNIVVFTIFLNTGYNTNSNNTHDIEEIAKATGGEFYTINSDDLINIFKQISKVTIGVDGKKDTDRDGIPDEIELGGMKSKQAQIVYTNPFDRDTDRDGILDNDEIGELSEDENGVQFYNMISDPSIPNGEIKEYKTVLGPSPDADPADVWATDFKFNKNAFRFENISVLENGGICAGIGYAIEHFYNGEEVYDNYNYNGEHFEFKLDDDELDILTKENLGLAYFYYPTTDELKSFTDKSTFNNKNSKMTQEYIDKKQPDNKLIRFLYYMWRYENAIKIQKFYGENGILPAIDQNKSVTEDTIDKLKILFDHDKIVVVRVPRHVVNGYALEKLSESKYRLYIYDNTAPYVKEKNCYIDLIKKKDKDEYKVEYHLGVGITNTTADHMVLFKYNDKFLNFTREVLAISE